LLPFTLGWIAPWRATRLQKIMTEDTRFGDRPLTFTAEAGPLYKRFAVMWIVTALTGLAVFGVLGLSTFNEFTNPDLATSTPQDPYRLGMLIGKLYAGLFLIYLVYYLLSAWYRAKATQHYAANTHFEGASFSSTVTGPGFVRLAIGNFAINMIGVTMGLLLIVLLFVVFGSLFSVDPTQEAADGARSVASQVIAIVSVLILISSAGLLAPIVQARSWRYLIANLKLNGSVPLGQIAQAAEQKMSRGEGLAQAFDIDGF
jgi:uncharacterized membrane protein YjgN (DUF898 family)